MFLFLGVHGADREVTPRSYGLFANTAVPSFRPHVQPLQGSWKWMANHRAEFKSLPRPKHPG
jgi:hypothetical protein